MRSLTPQQQSVIDWVRTGEGSAIVVAVAGAGKTTTLIEAAQHMQGAVLALAFNKTIAGEMKERMPLGVEVMTAHACGLRALSKGGAKRRVDNAKCAKLARDMWPSLEQSKCADLLKAVSLFKQFLIDPASADESKIEAIEEAHDLAPANRAKALQLLARSNSLSDIDFDDMVYLAPLKKALAPAWDWLLVDECQDLNAAQHEMIHQLLKPGGRVLFVGDPAQAIYAFRGADAESFSALARDFNCRELGLTVSFRCPQSIVKEAQRYVSHIEAHESAPAGIVETIGDKETARQAMRPADAVVCRFNAPLVSLCYSLLSDGRPARIVGRDVAQGLISLATRWVGRSFEELRGNLARWRDAETIKPNVSDATKERVADQCATLETLMDALAKDGRNLVSDLVAWIEANFSGDAADARAITLCTIHKAKGLEWPRVWYWGSEERPKQAPEGSQENNLAYVAVTRAKSELYLVPRVR